MDREISAEIIQKLKDSPSWLMLCHENPDADTLGSALALYSLGKRLGKNVRVAAKEIVPSRYSFLPLCENFEVIPIISKDDVRDTLVLSIDTSTLQRAIPGLFDALEGLDSINIDHHGDNKRYCRFNLVDPQASATAEIIIDLFDEAGWSIEEGEAVCLYAALSTDNGNFRFSSTTPKSHRCAAKLLEAGAQPAVIDDYVNENLSLSVLKLWGLALSRTEIFSDGRGAIFWLEKKDFEAANADASMVDGLVNKLLRLTGVKVAVFLTEIDGANKVSIRTKSPYSARELSSLFGGGGHIQAAGAKIPGTFEEALIKIRTEAERYADNRPASS